MNLSHVGFLADEYFSRNETEETRDARRCKENEKEKVSIRSLLLRFVPLGITVVHTEREKRITIAYYDGAARHRNLYTRGSRWINAPLCKWGI